MTLDRTTTLANHVFAGLSDRDLLQRHFPLLLSTGIPDLGLTVHSHFLTFLVNVGQSRGYSAVAECPIWWAANTGLGDVRADSVWFEKESGDASLALEFERFERGDESKLRGKVENLAIAASATPSLKLCVLMYWVRSGSAPRCMDAIIATYREGFRRRGNDVSPAGTPLMIVKCVMRPSVDPRRLVFGEFLRDERNEGIALGRM